MHVQFMQSSCFKLLENADEFKITIQFCVIVWNELIKIGHHDRGFDSLYIHSEAHTKNCSNSKASSPNELSKVTQLGVMSNFLYLNNEVAFK